MSRLFIGFSQVSDGCCALGEDSDFSKRANGTDNRKKLLQKFRLNARSIYTPQPDWDKKRIQEISPYVLSMNRRFPAECIITKIPNVPIAMHGGDCLSVLFADEPRTLVAAAHVPRCSLTDNFMDRVVKRLRYETKNPLEAYLGPCLQRQSHTLYFEDALDLVGERSDIKDYISEVHDSKRRSYFLLDYSGYVEKRLQDLGVTIMLNRRIDTYTDNNYFSSRRSRIREAKTDGADGLHLAVICLEPNPL